MKTIAQAITMVSWTDKTGLITPVRFKITRKDESAAIVKIDKIILRDKEKLAGNEMLIFRCQSELNGIQKIYEIKYELQSCKWILWKI